MRDFPENDVRILDAEYLAFFYLQQRLERAVLGLERRDVESVPDHQLSELLDRGEPDVVSTDLCVADDLCLIHKICVKI